VWKRNRFRDGDELMGDSKMSNSNQKHAIPTVAEQCAGFTMLETCCAMVIMFIAVLGSISLFVYSIKNNSGASDRELAMAVAQTQLEVLRNAPFTDASLNVANGVTTELTRAGRPYRMVTTIAHSNVIDGQPTLKTITITVAPLGTSLGSVTVRSVRATNKIGPNR
jgi:Tfp pilus assembly protein PilV